MLSALKWCEIFVVFCNATPKVKFLTLKIRIQMFFIFLYKGTLNIPTMNYKIRNKIIITWNLEIFRSLRKIFIINNKNRKILIMNVYIFFFQLHLWPTSITITSLVRHGRDKSATVKWCIDAITCISIRLGTWKYINDNEIWFFYEFKWFIIVSMKMNHWYFTPIICIG